MIRPTRPLAMVLLVLLTAGSVAVQAARDRRYGGLATEARLMYLQSPAVADRLALEYDALAADVYWIRAVLHYGGDRITDPGSGRYELLGPLLDLTTSLDPLFQIAYRFGAVFLAEPPPGGPGRLDLAERLLRKGMAASPERWQYPHDLGFLYYWQEQDHKTAAEWFRRASLLPGAPEWLAPLAAGMLARGGDRQASRQLLTRILEDAEHEWLRQTALRWLRQLDALDQMDQLDALLARFRAQAGAPTSWGDLIRARWLPGVPVDPTGYPYVLNATWSTTRLSPDSPLNPLPEELAR
jgi:tetratricopeptide (TPR) repeat protein